MHADKGLPCTILGSQGAPMRHQTTNLHELVCMRCDIIGIIIRDVPDIRLLFGNPAYFCFNYLLTGYPVPGQV